MHVCIKVFTKVSAQYCSKIGHLYVWSKKIVAHKFLQAICNLYYKSSFTGGLTCLLALDCAKLSLLVFLLEVFVSVLIWPFLAAWTCLLLGMYVFRWAFIFL